MSDVKKLLDDILGEDFDDLFEGIDDEPEEQAPEALSSAEPDEDYVARQVAENAPALDPDEPEEDDFASVLAGLGIEADEESEAPVPKQEQPTEDPVSLREQDEEDDTPVSDSIEDDDVALDEVTQGVTTETDVPKWRAARTEDGTPLAQFTADLAEDLNLRQYATLVTLNTARWHAKIKDKEAAAAAAAAAGADPDAFESHKHLLVGAKEKLDAVHKAIDKARAAHYRMTMPWSRIGVNEVGKRQGARLLPNRLFMEYTREQALAKQEMEAALNDFVSDYPNLVTKAQQHLGTSFNPSDYPNPASIRDHFSLAFDFHPIPDGDDFAGLTGQQAEKLAAKLNERNRVMAENAMQDLWSRLYKAVSHAAAVLGNPDKMFQYTTCDKLTEITDELETMNIVGDQRLEAVRKDLRKNLYALDAKEIRKDDVYRKQLGKEAKRILKELNRIAGADNE